MIPFAFCLLVLSEILYELCIKYSTTILQTCHFRGLRVIGPTNLMVFVLHEAKVPQTK